MRRLLKLTWLEIRIFVREPLFFISINAALSLIAVISCRTSGRSR